MLVLVVEDDSDYAEVIAHTLRRDHHEVVVFDTARGAVKFAERKPPGLAVLDVMLPDGSGIELCASLRRVAPELPVLFLSSLDRTGDVIAGLAAGGDDYLTKPFHPGELLARTRAVLRRSGHETAADPAARESISAHGFDVDPANHVALYRGTPLDCTPIEVEILAQLVSYPGRALSHAFLTEKVWGYKNVSDATLLKGHISSIRRRLRQAGGDDRMLRTVHGVGYSFNPEA